MPRRPDPASVRWLLFSLLLPVMACAQVADTASVVIFDGNPDTREWLHKHDASLLRKLSNLKQTAADGGLFIDIPGEREKTELGIGSKSARVWLDEFGAGATVTLTFELDPDRTNRFSFHLTHSVGEWSLNQPGMVFYWQPAEQGPGSEYGWYETPAKDKKAPVDHARGVTAQTAPARVSITISPGHLSVSVDDLPALDGPWSSAHAHAGFYLFAYTRTDSDGRAARLGLKRIVMTREPGADTQARPAADAMFPVIDRLAADGLDDWLFVEEGGKDLQGFARLQAGSMQVDVPPKHGWGRAGFTTTTPLVDTSPLNDQAPYLVELALDLDTTSGLYFVLGGEGVLLRDDNVRRTGYTMRFSVTRGPKDDHFTLQLRSGYYHDWERPLPLDWDGRLEVLIGWTDLTVRVPDGLGIVGELRHAKQDHAPYHLTLLAAPARAGDASRFRLNRFTLRQLVGDEIDAQTRFRLIPAERFDADAYLDALRQTARRALRDYLERPTHEDMK